MNIIGLVLPALGLYALSTNPWAEIHTPAPGPAASIGNYSNGCLKGGEQFPSDGYGFQTMHPERDRSYGHPMAVQLAKDIAERVFKATGKVALFVDFSQPRGGPSPTDHASHQIGLDFDLTLEDNPDAQLRPLTAEERAHYKMKSYLTPDGKKLDLKRWGTFQEELYRVTASDPRVQRVLLNPLIKKHLCNTLKGDDRLWLEKLRPWYNHDDHLHVRLFCPKDSPLCVPQAPVPAGDGCGAELDEWLGKHNESAGLLPPAPQTAPAKRKLFRTSGMPDECQKVLKM